MNKILKTRSTNDKGNDEFQCTVIMIYFSQQCTLLDPSDQEQPRSLSSGLFQITFWRVSLCELKLQKSLIILNHQKRPKNCGIKAAVLVPCS